MYNTYIYICNCMYMYTYIYKYNHTAIDMVNIDTKYVKSRHLGKARQKPVWHPFSAETFGKSILRSEVFGAVATVDDENMGGFFKK